MEKIYVPGSRGLYAGSVTLFFFVLFCAASYMEFKTSYKTRLLKEKAYIEVAIQNQNQQEIFGGNK